MRKKIKRRKNFNSPKMLVENEMPLVGQVTIKEESVPLDSYPRWYEQVIHLPEEARKEIEKKELQCLQNGDAKARAAYHAIKSAGMTLVGFMPKVEYARVEGDVDDLMANWVHHFSRPTLLFHNPQNNAGMFINAVLRYNDTILNEIKGNPRREIEGWTG